MIHPDPEKFQTAMDQIMQKSPIGLYVDVAVALIGHVFTETGSPTPEWLHGPTHFEGRGFTLVGLEPSASSDG